MAEPEEEDSQCDGSSSLEVISVTKDGEEDEEEGEEEDEEEDGEEDEEEDEEEDGEEDLAPAEKKKHDAVVLLKDESLSDDGVSEDDEELYVIRDAEEPAPTSSASAVDLIQKLMARGELTHVADVDASTLQRALASRRPSIPKSEMLQP